MEFEEALPNPEFLITSISEQGYSFESALADLIDNSITSGADKIEIITFNDGSKLCLYLSDNGNGMNSHELAEAMQFPSSSIAYNRYNTDLGRFGLGLKTASFSQCRRFTVLSKKKEGIEKFASRTWDVDFLIKQKKWVIGINDAQESELIFEEFLRIQNLMSSHFADYKPNTVVFWQGLIKFGDKPDLAKDALESRITSKTREYLGLIFHRYLNRPKGKNIQIKLNNVIVDFFDPFPIHITGVRPLQERKVKFHNEVISYQGFVLPNSARKDERPFVTQNKRLLDLEGIYVYRNDRIISFGHWNELFNKEPKLPLARFRLDIGNANDLKFQLTFDKTKIEIPLELQLGIKKCLEELKTEAKREFNNHGLRGIASFKEERNKKLLFHKIPSTNGSNILEFNEEYPLVKYILENTDSEINGAFKFFLKNVSVAINKFRDAHVQQSFNNVVETSMIDLDVIMDVIKAMKTSKFNYSTQEIKDHLINDLGIKFDDELPDEIKEELK